MSDKPRLETNVDIIVFNWPFDQPQVAVVTLRNRGNTRITVKCKTTERYAIRFSWVYTLLEPGESKKLNIRCEAIGDHPVHRGEKHITFEYMTVRKSTDDLAELWKSCTHTEKKIVTLYFDRRHSKSEITTKKQAVTSRRPSCGHQSDCPRRRSSGKHGQFHRPRLPLEAASTKKGGIKTLPWPAHPKLEAFTSGKQKTDQLLNFSAAKGNQPDVGNAPKVPDLIQPVDLPTSSEMKVLVMENDKDGYAKIISPVTKSDPKCKGLNKPLELADDSIKPPAQTSAGGFTKGLAKVEINLVAKVTPAPPDDAQGCDKELGNLNIGMSDKPRPPNLDTHEINRSQKEQGKAAEGASPGVMPAISADAPSQKALCGRRASGPLSFPASLPKVEALPGMPAPPSVPNEPRQGDTPTGLADIIPISVTTAAMEHAKMTEKNKEQGKGKKQNDETNLLKKP